MWSDPTTIVKMETVLKASNAGHTRIIHDHTCTCINMEAFTVVLYHDYTIHLTITYDQYFQNSHSNLKDAVTCFMRSFMSCLPVLPWSAAD